MWLCRASVFRRGLCRSSPSGVSGFSTQSLAALECVLLLAASLLCFFQPGKRGDGEGREEGQWRRGREGGGREGRKGGRGGKEGRGEEEGMEDKE